MANPWKYIRYTFVIVSLLVITGCATIITGTNQRFSVTSNPDAADVIIKSEGGVPICKGQTPAQFKLQRGELYTVIVKVAGYKEETVNIDKKINYWTLCNIFCSGSLGVIIDLITGALWTLDPDKVHVELNTVMLNGQPQLFAVVKAVDDNGQLRQLSVPLLRESN